MGQGFAILKVYKHSDCEGAWMHVFSAVCQLVCSRAELANAHADPMQMRLLCAQAPRSWLGKLSYFVSDLYNITTHDSTYVILAVFAVHTHTG